MTTKLMRFARSGGLAASIVAAGVMQAAAAPGILYDLGGKFDRSFNENAYNGAVRFKEKTGENFLEFEVKNDSQREQALRTFAQQGANPIVMVGFTWALALEKVAKEFPDTSFAIIDNAVDLPNVQSIEFAYNEGAFLVGALAGMKTETNKVGFVGGMDIPIIKDFACAYEHGAHFVNADVEVLENMTGTTPAAWSDPARGRELALGQYDRGADIVFAAAGGTTLGILQASADAGKLSIGVGQNQNGVHPGHVLTSATAEISTAVYLVMMDAHNGKLEPGVRRLGLAENGVGWSLDENNRALVSSEQEQRVEQIRQDIIDGKISVPSFLESGECPPTR